jgi:hypothetical protein
MKFYLKFTGYSKRAKWVINLTAALAGVNFLAFAHPRK